MLAITESLTEDSESLAESVPLPDSYSAVLCESLPEADSDVLSDADPLSDADSLGAVDPGGAAASVPEGCAVSEGCSEPGVGPAVEVVADAEWEAPVGVDAD